MKHEHVRLIQTVPPTEEPVDLADMYADHLRGSDYVTEAAYVARLWSTASRYGEHVTLRSWMPQTWQQIHDRFPEPCENNGRILMRRGPLIEVASITYIDGAGVTQTLAAERYKVSNAGRSNQPSRIAPAYGDVWPVTRCEMDAVVITFQAGYVSPTSPAGADVPDDLVHGALLVVGELYKTRSESVAGGELAPAFVRARDLWAPYRLYR